MTRRPRVRVCFAAAIVLLVPLAGCSGDDSSNDEADKAVEVEQPVAGSFVGEVSGTKAFVAVVAAPAAGKKDSRAVHVYVADGRRLSKSFSGSISGNSFVAKSDDGAEAKGKLSGDSVTGTIELPGGTTVRYEAGTPAGAAGLYDLTVSAEGELSGASAAGLGVTGEVTMRRRGTGTLELVDGTRLELEVTRNAAGGLVRLRAGQVRLILLPSGQLRGAGGNFFIRSST